MLKEKILLSNCDSVRRLSKDELKKRFLTGMVFGDGVVLSPNILIDNMGMHELLSRKNLVKYLNEEGFGKLIIRGFTLDRDMTLLDYYESLPENFIFSSIDGGIAKRDLDRWQEQSLTERIKETQKALGNLGYVIEPMEIGTNSLTQEVSRRLDDDNCIGYFFDDDGERILFRKLVSSSGVVSRSDWYAIADRYFLSKNKSASSYFKAEVIDPAYHSLFAKKGEGFLQDNIKSLSNVPGLILDAGITYKALKNEVELFEYALTVFEFVSSLGSSELLKFITDQAMGYIEEKISDKGISYLSRKNWFGMYPKIRNIIGLEIK